MGRWIDPEVEEKGEVLMSPCTRATRVGWLGFGCLTVASMAASAGQVKLSCESRSEVAAHDPEKAERLPPIDGFDRASSASAQTTINNNWLVYDAPTSSGRANVGDNVEASTLSSSANGNPVLSIPFAPIGIVGLVGMGSGLLYAGARMLGLRK